jgi:hypothetical protein
MRSTRYHVALRVMHHLLLILLRIATDKHRGNLSLHILWPRNISHCHLILRIVMVHLPLYYLKLVHSVLRIIPWVCMINRILNSIHHLIIVGGHVLLCEVAKRLKSTYWVIAWHIPLVSVVVHIINSYSSSIDTLKLIHACIVFCMITFCFWCPRIQS